MGNARLAVRRPDVKVTWVLREPKYFTGGEGDADLIKITAAQLISPTGVEVVTAGQWALDLWYRSRFVRAGVKDWLPKERLDISTMQVGHEGTNTLRRSVPHSLVRAILLNQSRDVPATSS
jgi:hypothetical protein